MKQNEINISFYLKRTSPKKELKKRAVYITIAFRGTQIKMSTGIIIEDPGDYWKSGMFTHPKFYEQNTKMYKIKEQILAYDATHFKTAEDIRNAYEGVDIHETPLTIFEALDFGLQFKIEEGLQAETTSKSQRCIINKFERFRIAKKAPNWGTIKNHPRMLSRGVVKQFIKWLSDPSNGECNGAMKAVTINNYVGVLGANYEAYYKQHIDVEPNLINNPFYGNVIKIDAQESTNMALSKAIDWKWIEKIEKLRYQPIDIDAKRSNYEDSTKYNEKFRLIVLLLVYTGMAFVELGKKDVLEVTNSLEGPMLKNRRKKTGKNYMVPLTKKIAQVIEDLGVIPWEPFIDSRFKMVDYRLYKNSYKVLSRFCEKLSEDIGLDEPFTCHDLRHTFAMRMINHYGFSIRVVARMLGDREDMVRKCYGDYTDEFILKEMNEAMEKFRESENKTLESHQKMLFK
jgi:integrase